MLKSRRKKPQSSFLVQNNPKNQPQPSLLICDFVVGVIVGDMAAGGVNGNLVGDLDTTLTGTWIKIGSTFGTETGAFVGIWGALGVVMGKDTGAGTWTVIGAFTGREIIGDDTVTGFVDGALVGTLVDSRIDRNTRT